MNLTDEQVLDHIINEHPAALAAKFRDGMTKYPTPLIEKDCLAEAIPEVQDLVVYLSAATLQKKRAFELVRALKPILQARGFHMFPDEWYELEELLAPKLLARKKLEIDESRPPKTPDKGTRWRNHAGGLFEFDGAQWVYIDEAWEKLPKSLTDL